MYDPTCKIRRIAVFCGASSGKDPRYIDAAKAFGEELVKRQYGLVYGGGELPPLYDIHS